MSEANIRDRIVRLQLSQLMYKRSSSDKQNSSALHCLHCVILEQRAATEELKQSTRELEATLEEFQAVCAELRAAASVVPRDAPETDTAAPASQPPEPVDLSIADLKRQADQVLKKGQEAVRESALVRLRSSKVRAALQSSSPAPSKVAQRPAASLGALSRRERQVLTLIVAGKSSKEIAAELGISFRTAVTHRASIMGKLNVHEIASVVREAIHRGLV
jgi:DNA-binding CsgD family transcriptional regulator